jgi:hypothetical protein
MGDSPNVRWEYIDFEVDSVYFDKTIKKINELGREGGNLLPFGYPIIMPF